MLKKILLILTALLGIGANPYFMKDTLPFHSQAYQGQLENGLRYVILPNHFPS